MELKVARIGRDAREKRTEESIGWRRNVTMRFGHDLKSDFQYASICFTSVSGSGT